jgi:ArsR family transcriptional regulator, arsenate/arsenite/antimonite-responsive transcriptional repressor
MTLSKTLSALSDPTRQRILELLKKNDLPAGAIGKHFSITAPSLSHHLNILKQADLISSRREGQEMIYSLNLSVFEEAAEKLIKFFKIR